MAARKKAAKKAAKKKATKKAPARAARAPKKAAKVAKKVAKKAPVRAAPPPKPAKPSKPKKAPLLWRFKTKQIAFGVFVDDNLGWVADESGEVFALTPTGEIHQSFKLPDGVKCLIADEAWRYAGCNDGNVYDLGSRVPRLVYSVSKDAEILWLDIYRGNLCVSDDAGGLTVVDAEDNLKWKKKDSKDGSGWMVRADGTGVYHGHDRGVTKYDWSGKKLWHTKTPDVLFGWQEADAVFAGTMNDIRKIDKESGKLLVTYDCGQGGVPSCAASPGGNWVFGADSGKVICFNGKGPHAWTLESGCGTAMSMQYHGEKLYLATTDGYLGCIDASEAAIEKAQAGQIEKAQERKAPKVEAVASTTLEKTTDTSKGVVLECIKDGGQLRVRVVSSGFQKGWFCQFPKDIRKEGAKYLVEEVREASQGGFYRVLGEIKQVA